MVIAVDFDGTCTTHEYPSIGKDIGAVPVLKKLVRNGHKLIIWTMRSGKELNDAKEWYIQNVIPFYAANENPQQLSWTNSPKVLAELYIDDAALGCPLDFNTHISSRSFVDWVGVEVMLEDMKLI